MVLHALDELYRSVMQSGSGARLTGRVESPVPTYYEGFAVALQDQESLEDMLCYPSVLASSLRAVEEYILRVKADPSNQLIRLVLDNMSVVATYLRTPPVCVTPLRHV